MGHNDFSAVGFLFSDGVLEPSIRETLKMGCC